MGPVALLWLQKGVLASRLFPQINAAFLSLDHVTRGCQIVLKADLGWLTHTEQGWILGSGLLGFCCWPSGLEWCVLVSTMVLPLLMVLEGSSGAGRHPLPYVTPCWLPGWPPHALHGLRTRGSSGSSQGGWVYFRGFLILLLNTSGTFQLMLSLALDGYGNAMFSLVYLEPCWLGDRHGWTNEPALHTPCTHTLLTLFAGSPV